MVLPALAPARSWNQRFSVIMPPNVGVVCMNAFADSWGERFDFTVYWDTPPLLWMTPFDGNSCVNGA
jgi:hypothetical protein